MALQAARAGLFVLDAMHLNSIEGIVVMAAT